MLNSIIVGGEPEAVTYLRQVCAEFEDICVYKTIASDARRYEVVATLNAYAPDLVFLGLNEPEEDSAATICLEELLRRGSQTAIVPFSNRPANPAYADAVSLRLGPVLRPPFHAEQLEEALREALRRSKPQGASSQVIAVMPAKPGAGATTLALNIAGLAANEFRKRTLLVEADHHCGALMYLLKLELMPGTQDGNWAPHHLVDREWNRMVSRSHAVDVLPCLGAARGQPKTRWDFARLLRFASERYDVVLVDLPPILDETCESIMADADKVLLVCTSEIPSLEMLRRRLFEMERNGFQHSHLEVVVNRYTSGDPTPDAMSATARHPLHFTLPEDRDAARAATRNCSLIGEHSKLRRSLLPFAAELLGYANASPTGPFGFLNGKLFRKVFRNPAVGPNDYERPVTNYMEAKGVRYNPDRRR